MHLWAPETFVYLCVGYLGLCSPFYGPRVLVELSEFLNPLLTIVSPLNSSKHLYRFYVYVGFLKTYIDFCGIPKSFVVLNEATDFYLVLSDAPYTLVELSGSLGSHVWLCKAMNPL